MFICRCIRFNYQHYKLFVKAYKSSFAIDPRLDAVVPVYRAKAHRQTNESIVEFVELRECLVGPCCRVFAVAAFEHLPRCFSSVPATRAWPDHERRPSNILIIFLRLCFAGRTSFVARLTATKWWSFDVCRQCGSFQCFERGGAASTAFDCNRLRFAVTDH